VISEYSGHLFPILAGPDRIKTISVAIIAGFGILQMARIRGKRRATFDGCAQDRRVFSFWSLLAL